MYTHCYLTGVDGTFIGILVFANANTKYKIQNNQNTDYDLAEGDDTPI